jgi:hypothetical protein
VYVVSDGQLTALEPLPIRVPDVQVAISGTITKPAPVAVPNGKVVFVVYHRDLTASVPDKASVRVIAQMMRPVRRRPRAFPAAPRAGGPAWEQGHAGKARPCRCR